MESRRRATERRGAFFRALAEHGPSVSRTPSHARGRQGHATVLIDAIVRWLGQHYGHIVPALCCRHVYFSPPPLPPTTTTTTTTTITSTRAASGFSWWCRLKPYKAQVAR
jgi:hypothetical protein